MSSASRAILGPKSLCKRINDLLTEKAPQTTFLGKRIGNVSDFSWARLGVTLAGPLI
jgi:hypothetical protein